MHTAVQYSTESAIFECLKFGTFAQNCPALACMEAVFGRSYEIRLERDKEEEEEEWAKEEEMVYFKSRGRCHPIFATSNKTQCHKTV